MGVGLKISDGGEEGEGSGRQNKRITFDSDDDDDGQDDDGVQDIVHDDKNDPGVDKVNDSNASEDAAADAVGDSDDDDDDDDDAVEEVKSGAARADAMMQIRAEREMAREAAVSTKKKRRSNKRKQQEVVQSEEEKEDVPDDDSKDEQAQDDDLDEEFLAMVDSERQTELQLRKLRKKAEKRRKLQAEKKIGRHTTFVSDDGDGLIEGGFADPIQAEHGIDVVVLPSVKRATAGGRSDDSDNDDDNDEDEGYGRVDVSAVLGSAPSKAASLFSRGNVTCGDVTRKGNKKVMRAKGGKKRRKEEGWQRSRKMTHLSIARGSRMGAPAANFVNKKRTVA